MSSSTSKAGVDLQRVQDALAPVLRVHGVECVEVQWLTGRSGWTLRVTIERPNTTAKTGFGVMLEDCVDVSRDLSVVLDAEDLIPHHYNLEVSSPGLDRPLRTMAEIRRFAGELAKVKLKQPAEDGQRVLRGRIEDVGDTTFGLSVDGKAFEVALDNVAEAHLAYELATSPKPTGKPSSGGAKPGGSSKARPGATASPAKTRVGDTRNARKPRRESPKT